MAVLIILNVSQQEVEKVGDTLIFYKNTVYRKKYYFSKEGMPSKEFFSNKNHQCFFKG